MNPKTNELKRNQMCKNIFISLITCIAITGNLNAQEKSRKELKGDKYYFVYSYDKAIYKYSHAKQLSIEGQRKLADSYSNMDQDIKSEATYSKIVNSPGSLPEDNYNYAMVLKTDAKYEESDRSMNKFIALKPADLRGKDYSTHNTELAGLLKDDGKYKIQHLDVNTDAEDFGASYYKDKIVFTSTRATPKMVKRNSNRNGKPYLNIYVADLKDGQMKDPQNFDKSLNNKLNDGPSSFSKDGNYMAFTRNNYELTKKDKIVKLEIYFRTYRDGKWSKPEPFVLNNKEYSVGHPNLSADGKTMYFTSDMPGGYGKADIYRITKSESGVWGNPENLGNKINTEGDEMFPFYEEKNEVLFFASNGLFGLGGLDIFICTASGSGFTNIYNAGSPLNTQYDDFSIIVDEKLQKGFFSSNRMGGSGDDDIYAVDILKSLNIGKRIEGIAKDKTGNPVPFAFVTLFNEKKKTTDTITTKESAAYSFLVDTDTEFKLVGKKEKYKDGDTTVNTSGTGRIVKADVILLTNEEIIREKMVVGADLTKILDLGPVNFPSAEIIYFDLDKFNIRLDAVPELDKIVSIMNKYPDMVVELGSHTDCRDNKEYNQVLSNKRAKASADYIKARITKPERIYGKGYGETKLVNGCACEGVVISDCSEEDHQKNRRTEFIIVKK
jgi:outer membrane protein OmpA-like peptidoglycan-associated protein